MVVNSCKTFGEIICIKMPDTSFLLACLKGIGWFAAIYHASLEKHQLEAKTGKMATPLHIIALRLLHCCAEAENFYSLAVQGNK